MVYVFIITMFVQVCLLNNKTHEPPLVGNLTDSSLELVTNCLSGVCKFACSAVLLVCCKYLNARKLVVLLQKVETFIIWTDISNKQFQN
jgi:hypothetical protein